MWNRVKPRLLSEKKGALTIDQATRLVGKAQLLLYELEQKYLYLTHQDPIHLPKFLTYTSLGTALVQLRDIQVRIKHVNERLDRLAPLPEKEASAELMAIAEELQLEVYI